MARSIVAPCRVSIRNHVPADNNFVLDFSIFDGNQHNLLFLVFCLFLEKLRAINLLLFTCKHDAYV